jgi:hypothetical protein
VKVENAWKRIYEAKVKVDGKWKKVNTLKIKNSTW